MSDEDSAPACLMGNRDDRDEWRLSDLTDGLLAFKRPCKSCFPDGEIPEGVEQVVRAGSYGETVHRPRERTAATP